MKKFKTMMAMMLALVSMCVAFSSCSSDDDDNTAGGAKEIVGTYTSTLNVSVKGQPSTYEDKTVKVEAVDDNTVKITLPSFGEGMMTLPEFTVPAVKVSSSNGGYVLAQTTYTGTALNAKGEGKQYTVTLEGSFKNNTLSLKFTPVFGGMPATIKMIATFEATKK